MGLKLQNLLESNRAAVLKRWFNLIMETYPADAQKFLKQGKDQFANPVGTTIGREIETVFSELIGEMDPDNLKGCLDKIIRIRAVQEFSPSQAVSLVFLLKQAIKEELGDRIREEQLFEELLKLESRIDEAALFAFDLYMGCREKLYEIRANEIRNRSLLLLQRMNQKPRSRDRQGDLDHGVIGAGNNEER